MSSTLQPRLRDATIVAVLLLGMLTLLASPASADHDGGAGEHTGHGTRATGAGGWLLAGAGGAAAASGAPAAAAVLTALAGAGVGAQRRRRR